MVRLRLLDKRTGKIFYKEFPTEFERDKFRRKLRYSKHLVVQDGYDTERDY